MTNYLAQSEFPLMDRYAVAEAAVAAANAFIDYQLATNAWFLAYKRFDDNIEELIDEMDAASKRYDEATTICEALAKNMVDAYVSKLPKP
jgi:uncharacterized protein YfbU (UPF0304 family)